MRVRSAQPAEERSLQEKSPKRVRQPTPSARLRDQPHDNRTTRRVQGRWTGTILTPSIQADAATRPQDQVNFRRQMRFKGYTDLLWRRG